MSVLRLLFDDPRLAAKVERLVAEALDGELVERLTRDEPSDVDLTVAYAHVLRRALSDLEFPDPRAAAPRDEALAALDRLLGAPRGAADAMRRLVVEALSSWPPARRVGDFLRKLAVAVATVASLDHPTSEEHNGAPSSADGPNNSPSDPQEEAMALYMDLRGLPQRLAQNVEEAQTKFTDAVKAQLKALISNEPSPILAAYVAGKLLRDGQYDERSPSFVSFVKRTWDGLVVPQPARGRSSSIGGIDLLDLIAKALGLSNGAAKETSFQQLAFVFGEVSKTLATIGPDDRDFKSRVERAHLDYAAGESSFDNFEIPSLDMTIDADIIPENMLAVGKLYAAYQFERLKLFAVTDRIMELWKVGVVPIGNDSGGMLLNKYYWERDERLPEGARLSVYGRIFGVKGVDVSKDAQPNATFDSLLQRFLTNVAQLRRLEEQQVVLSGADQSKALMGENVRKTARELASNISLYGWGGCHFDASRIAAHIDHAFKILSDAQVQKAFAATSPWQVVERVSQQELGVTPNISMFHTMATSGRKVIEILAQNPAALVEANGDFATVLGEAWPVLARHALAYLSVNGVTGDQLVSYSRPVEAIASPALPTMPGMGSSPDPDMSRVRDMVASGQMPSLDQLQRMFVN